MFLGKPGGKNALWTNPSAATNDAVKVWCNVGGEKTWVGTMETWKGFNGGDEAPHWPPPIWFDSAPLEVVRADETNMLLRSGYHTSENWTVALEREFTLKGERLVAREKLINVANLEMLPMPIPNIQSTCAKTTADKLEIGNIGIGNNGNICGSLSDDRRRVWSVTQIPLVDIVEAHLAGEGRSEYFGNCPPLSSPDSTGWSKLDLSGATQHARVAFDGDALAASIPGVGRLVIEQTAGEKHLSAFATPSRAIVYTTGKDFASSKWTGWCREPYIELEFVALGPDAEQILTFRIESEDGNRKERNQ